MPRSQLLYLNDISESIQNIRLYVGARTFREFQNDRMRIDAVVRNFEVIGEAVKNLSDELKAQFPHTDWKAVAGFRDTLIHGYFGIDLDILWDIIVNKIPLLEKQVADMIAYENAKDSSQEPII